jgi:hypothetical protein
VNLEAAADKVDAEAKDAARDALQTATLAGAAGSLGRRR